MAAMGRPAFVSLPPAAGILPFSRVHLPEVPNAGFPGNDNGLRPALPLTPLEPNPRLAEWGSSLCGMGAAKPAEPYPSPNKTGRRFLRGVPQMSAAGIIALPPATVHGRRNPHRDPQHPLVDLVSGPPTSFSSPYAQHFRLSNSKRQLLA